MRFIFSILFITVSFALPAAAQSRVELQKFFEGKRVTLRIDMPTAKGVDVYPERSQSFDYEDYNEQLRSGGVAIARGANALIKDVKVHDNSIEVVFENQNGTQAHFKLRYARLDSWMLGPVTLIDALNRFVQFSPMDKAAARTAESPVYASGYVRKGVVHLGARTTYLKLGLTTREVVRLLGEPVVVSRRIENGETIATYQFERGNDRILIAEFLSDSLVDSRTIQRSTETVPNTSGS